MKVKQFVAILNQATSFAHLRKLLAEAKQPYHTGSWDNRR